MCRRVSPSLYEPTTTVSPPPHAPPSANCRSAAETRPSHCPRGLHPPCEGTHRLPPPPLKPPPVGADRHLCAPPRRPEGGKEGRRAGRGGRTTSPNRRGRRLAISRAFLLLTLPHRPAAAPPHSAPPRPTTPLTDHRRDCHSRPPMKVPSRASPRLCLPPPARRPHQ